MKELLKSKLFKRNLRKWLFMYIAVIALFTSVVTYSKYVSSFMSNDEARVTKFNVKITALDENGNICNDSCYNKTYTINDDFKFYFAIDTSEIEVETDLYVTVNVDENFEMISLRKKDNEEYTDISFDSLNKTQIYSRLNNTNVGITTYEITVKYNPKKLAEINNYEIINVGYSAKQIAR